VATGPERSARRKSRHVVGLRNPVADVAGATAAGLPSILVRTGGEAAHAAATLDEAAAIVLGTGA
jgi:ribonucleotide monophosphatase NagD (HAD superfamily)